jgi:hypothetical protein
METKNIGLYEVWLVIEYEEEILIRSGVFIELAKTNFKTKTYLLMKKIIEIVTKTKRLIYATIHQSDLKF